MADACIPEVSTPPSLWKIFTVFARIGLFTFGGGYAMLPLIQKEVVEKNRWAEDEQILDYYAIGQCTPGVIAVNTATFIGYKLKGIAGGVTATLGVITPSIIIISAFAAFLKNFSGNSMAEHAFAGIRVAVVALIVQAIIKLWKSSIADAVCTIIFALSFAAVAFFKVSPILVTLGAAAAGTALRRLCMPRIPPASGGPAASESDASAQNTLSPSAASLEKSKDVTPSDCSGTAFDSSDQSPAGQEKNAVNDSASPGSKPHPNQAPEPENSEAKTEADSDSPKGALTR